MQIHGLQAPQPTRISITPVTNGWIVEIPGDYNPAKEIMKTVTQALADSQLDDIERIMRDSKKKAEDDEPFSRNTALHVFKDFEDLLHFLAERFIQK